LCPYTFEPFFFYIVSFMLTKIISKERSRVWK
jgi:hypothetical protein